ncbi:GDPGTP exchange factor Sec2p [Niveomyces insectorum RCEF 264]|uniref:GDPGTP exchange factor Sec2p n=1 Tax=Niveomyces insectorum RCEF 264 TaxID=1081102 RepID=A0A162JCR3_9HYPO|nr:GDPGTP exchange factor Sec2p [Niveomyces insectorum RCEF 264]
MASAVAVTPPDDVVAAATVTTVSAVDDDNDDTSPPSCLCPKCGATVETRPALRNGGGAGDDTDALDQARRQIQDLEGQVRLLDQKAAAAIDRWADYEDELTRLRRQLSAATAAAAAPPSSSSSSSSLPSLPPPSSSQRTPPRMPAPPPTPASPTRTSFLPTGAANRLSALLSPRSAKSTPNLKAAATTTATALPPPPLPPPLQLQQPHGDQPRPAMPTPPPSAVAIPTTAANSTAAAAGTAGTSPYAHYATSSSVSSSASPPPPPRTPYGSFSFFGGKSNGGGSPSPSPRQQQAVPPVPSVPKAGAAHPAIDTEALLAALTREQALRRAAEGRLNDTSREVEELSVSLFEQANAMVADERRARARLEARVAVLEQRDTDKKRRLERLEQAMDRIERVRALLGQPTMAAEAAAAAAAAAAATATSATMTGVGAGINEQRPSTANSQRLAVPLAA